MLPDHSFGKSLDLEIKWRQRFLYFKIQEPDELLLSGTCKLCLETELLTSLPRQHKVNEPNT